MRKRRAPVEIPAWLQAFAACVAGLSVLVGLEKMVSGEVLDGACNVGLGVALWVRSCL